MDKHRGSSLPKQPVWSHCSSCTEEYSTFLLLQPLGNVIITSETKGILPPAKGSGLIRSCSAPNLWSKVKPRLVIAMIASRVMHQEPSQENPTYTSTYFWHAWERRKNYIAARAVEVHRVGSQSTSPSFVSFRKNLVWLLQRRSAVRNCKIHVPDADTSLRGLQIDHSDPALS